MKKKIGIIVLIILSIMLIVGIAYNVYAKYVLSKKVSVSFDTSDYYFNVDVDQTEITVLPATINVKVKNYEGENFTDTDLEYTLSASNPNLDIEVNENEGFLNGGSKQETEYQIKISAKNNAEWVKDTLYLEYDIKKPYTDKKQVAINIDYKTINITVDLAQGMIPLKYKEGIGWIRSAPNDSEWYSYGKKEWANIVLGDATFIEKNNYEVLDESKPYSMLVYVPRYAYQITSMYHQTGNGGNINIKFIDKNNKDINDTSYSASYPTYQTGTGMNDYVVHPAFTYGDNELNGIWVGKFESSHTGCTTDVTTGQKDFTGDEVMTIKAGVTSWRNINISNSFSTCRELNKENNDYGLSSNDNVVDPHLIKNSEWGAVAYLSQNVTYGKGNEIWINANSNFITGQAGNSVSDESTTETNPYNTTNGQQASTNGNITGIYDMSGGAYEYVATYISNGNSNLITNGEAIVNAEERYKDVYNIGNEDTQISNYLLSTPSNGKYGDAIYETSNAEGGGYRSWYLDFSSYSAEQSPFLGRGAGNYNNTSAGIFSFNRGTGANANSCSFHIVIPVFKAI